MSMEQLMAQRREIVSVDEVEPMIFASGESHASLIEPEGVGSRDLTVSRYILPAHAKNGGGVHSENDEAYYVLRGRAHVLLGGSEEDGAGGRWSELEPDMAVFIPAGTFHHLKNDGDEDFVILTICPRLPRPGSGLVNELKKSEWGTTFRLKHG
jgi:mannose-6-phosphate isomerase-like protein (cupin superfamily)